MTAFLILLFLALLAPPEALLAEKVTYRYDESGRLVQLTYESGRTITYIYDKAGNLTRREVTGGEAPAGAEAQSKAKQADSKRATGRNRKRR